MGQDESIKLYLAEMAKIPLISKEEMDELLERMRNNDDEARKRLVTGNLRLVVSIAKKFNRPGVELNDLIEAGNMGLIAASRKFDPDREAKFSTYSYNWIKEYIRRAVLTHSKPIHIPVYVYQNFQKIMKAWDYIYITSGEKPSYEELAEATGFKKKDVQRFLYYIRVFSEIPSLDAPISKDIDIPLKATIAAQDGNDPEDAIGVLGIHQQLEELLVHISPREREVIRLRFGVGTSHPHTLQDVGEKLNISRERVRQIHKKALDKLKKAAVSIEKESEDQGDS
ncbi:MAG: RNA polymerase sigma factor RpoD/SigA [Elusimicrobia bacterium]|nr:RNA polymerase sigma factor RpoD/SigA [Elusimicrobiota bacterium]